MTATTDAPRIASLVPSGTDLVAALGLADRLVGVSHECDHPVARGLPRLTSSVLPAPDAHPDPAEVDRAVNAAVAAGTPLYRTDTDTLARLRPDVVLAQSICDVCAVSGPEVAGMLPPGSRLVMLTAGDVAGLWRDIRETGAALGRSDAAERLVADVQQRFARVADAVGGRPRPRVLTIEWPDPPFLGGHWVPELIAVAGGTHLLVEPGAPSRRCTWDEVIAADPDVVVLMPCGYDLDAAVAAAPKLPLDRLRASAEGRVWALDANRFTSRCTPMIDHTVHLLAGILHPDAFAAPDAADARRIAAPTPAG